MRARQTKSRRWSGLILRKGHFSADGSARVRIGAATKQAHSSNTAQQRYNGSRSSSSCLCASSYGVCVAGWCTTCEIEPRQTHIVGPHTSGIRTMQHQQLIHILGTPVFPLFDLRRLRDIKSTITRRGTLYRIRRCTPHPR